MTQLLEEKNTYLSNFTQFERGPAEKGPAWLRQIRSTAIDRFAELGFPTLRDEEWRFTNVAPIAQVPFQSATLFELNAQAGQPFQRASFPVGTGSRLVFVNGRYAPKLSTLGPLPDGVTVTSLAEVLRTHPDWVEPYLAQYAKYEGQPFTALNTAFIQDGA